MTSEDSAPPRLTPDSPLEEVRAYLRAFRNEVANLDDIDRAVAREQAIRDLTEVEDVSAPAKAVDVALNKVGRATPHDDDLHQGGSLAVEDPDAWPEDVDGTELLNQLTKSFTRFLALPEGAAPALALWTTHAHAQEASLVSPVLAITSPEKRCGKTTLLELLSAVVPRPLPASNVTPATVFRAVERWRPTLLVDEADTFVHDGSELRGILNSGHRRSLAYVVRTVGDDHEARRFRTWAPKAIALIGELPDTLADRSIEVRMRRRAPDEEVERLRLDRLESELEPLRRRAWTWAQAHLRELEDADPEMPAGLHDRERDNWRPLLAIADAAGGPWPNRAREAARDLREDEQDDRSLGTRLLADVRKVFESHPSDRIRSKELVKRLCNLEEAPWSEYKGRGLSTVSLANFLRSFDVSSKTIRFTGGTYKGYEADAFEDAFRRYLDPPPSAEIPESRRNTRNNAVGSGENDENEGVTSPADVTPSKSPGRPGASGSVTDVTPSERGTSEGEPPEEEYPGDLFDRGDDASEPRRRRCACGTSISEGRNRCDSCAERLTEMYLALPDPDAVDQFGEAHPGTRPPAGGWVEEVEG